MKAHGVVDHPDMGHVEERLEMRLQLGRIYPVDLFLIEEVIISHGRGNGSQGKTVLFNRRTKGSRVVNGDRDHVGLDILARRSIFRIIPETVGFDGVVDRIPLQKP